MKTLTVSNKKSSFIYCISDLHISDGGYRDNFQLYNREKRFRDFIHLIKKHNAELIIIGDLLDFWVGNLGIILDYRDDLLSLLKDVNIKYITGNHDSELEYLKKFLPHEFFKKIVKPFTRTINGKTFRFFHSHELDQYNCDPNPGWGRLMAILSALYIDREKSLIDKKGRYIEARLEILGDKYMRMFNCLVGVFRRFLGFHKSNIKYRLSPSKSRNRIEEHLNEVAEYRKKEGFDNAVCGHTHLYGFYGKDNWYKNTGSWVEDHNNVMIISKKTGKSKILDFSDDGIKTLNRIITPKKPYDKKEL